MNKKMIHDMVTLAITENAENLGYKLPTTITENLTLYGENSIFDSLGLVTLIINIEQKIEDHFNIEVNLASEKALSIKNSPFLTVKSLINYVLKILERC